MANLTSLDLQLFYKKSPMREGVLNWYPFEKNASVLENSDGALTALLQLRCKHVVSFDNGFDNLAKFDYVVSIDPRPITVELLKQYYSFLKPNGRLLLAFENPFGLQYFAGKRNPCTNIPYTFLESENKAQVETRIKAAGFQKQKWYYPFTNHYFTREVYSDNYLPNGVLNNRGGEFLEDDYTKEFDERGMWHEVVQNGGFRFVCHSFLVEACVGSGSIPCNVDFAAITAYREPNKAFVTTIHNDGTVYKKALYPEGLDGLRRLEHNHRELAKLGVPVLPVKLTDNALKMERLFLPTLWDYWVEKLMKGALEESELFFHYDQIRNAIYQAAKSGKCFWELVPANCFYNNENGELIFFDQEYYYENVDPDVALIRAICALQHSVEFQKDPRTAQWISKLQERFHLTEKWDEQIRIAEEETRKTIFNDHYNWPILCADKRAVERAAERTAERNAERLAKKKADYARYHKMSVVADAVWAMHLENVAIYGYGQRGKMLRMTLEINAIGIVWIVDKNHPIVIGIPLFSEVGEIEDFSNVDLLIVTPLQDADTIKSELIQQVSCPVMTIEELYHG